MMPPIQPHRTVPSRVACIAFREYKINKIDYIFHIFYCTTLQLNLSLFVVNAKNIMAHPFCVLSSFPLRIIIIVQNTNMNNMYMFAAGAPRPMHVCLCALVHMYTMAHVSYYWSIVSIRRAAYASFIMRYAFLVFEKKGLISYCIFIIIVILYQSWYREHGYKRRN